MNPACLIGFRPATVLLALVLVACQGEPDSRFKAPPFRVSPGVQQLTVTDAEPKLAVTLLTPEGKEVVTLITDEYGQANFAYVPSEPVVIQTGESGEFPTYNGATLKPGQGYRLRVGKAVYGPWRILGIDDHPPVSLYENQRLDRGMNYIKTRDGTLLSAAVWLPDPVLCGEGPWPTVVEYSGYSPANPRDPQPGSQLANLLLCYVSVGVNLRGTGCSGGVFDVFNAAQYADAYDAIEVVGRQPFVLHSKVGMVGLSYAGIMQLYAAITNPPHLAAITPLSVIDDPWRQAWPGGIYNSGFTRNWIEARDRYAMANGGDWVRERIEEGDAVCEANQRIRSQNVNFQKFVESLTTFPPDADERRLSNLVPRIDVPVFLTGAWQDEQTGSRFAAMLDQFTNAPVKRFTMFNGRHPDGYLPIAVTRWAEFLEFYVAKRIPRINALFRLLDNEIFKMIVGTEGLSFEDDRFTKYQNYDEALAAYEAEPAVRVLFESGFGNAVTEAPVARFERSFTSWPPQAEAREWYLGPDGRLLDAVPATPAPGDTGFDSYLHDPEAGAKSFIVKDSMFRINWRWEPAGSGYALGYMADAFAEDTFIIGNGGWADLWFASEATDANVEVSILEVRPDGTEFLIQNGVFSAKFRDGPDTERSGPFHAEYLYSEESVNYLIPGEFVRLRVPIRPFAHVFRAGTKIRLVIDTPGRDHGFWEYRNPRYSGDIVHTIARTPAKPSSLRLPIVSSVGGEAVPNPAPPCYSLRGIVCRPWLEIDNRATPSP